MKAEVLAPFDTHHFAVVYFQLNHDSASTAPTTFFLRPHSALIFQSPHRHIHSLILSPFPALRDPRRPSHQFLILGHPHESGAPRP